MIWQDVLISITNIIFSAALIPQIYYGHKQKIGAIQLQTSIPTFLGLYAIAFAFFTLHLYLSTILSIVAGTLWFILFMQRLVYAKEKISENKNEVI